MRFPLRLSAALFYARIANLFGGRDAATPILRLSLASRENGITSWIPAEAIVARATETGSQVVWFCGADPLNHPEVGRLSSTLADAKRHVFLHTDGYQLRQKIHGFRPDPRLFLTVQLWGREETHNRVMRSPDAFQRALEGIRAAKLSGFLVAAHFPVGPETDSCEIGELIEFLDGKDVDGFIVSSGGKSYSGETAQSVAEALTDATTMIRCGRWERFSRLLEKSYGQDVSGHAVKEAVAAGENAFEEGD